MSLVPSSIVCQEWKRYYMPCTELYLKDTGVGTTDLLLTWNYAVKHG